MTTLKTNILTPVSRTEMAYRKDVFITVHDGKIEAIADTFPTNDFLDRSDMLVIPPFCDLHNHMAQYRIMGMNAATLLEWLSTFTFPEELRLNRDHALARNVFASYYRDLLRFGTIASVSYATSSNAVARIACEEAASFPGWMFIGKVLMERNAPEDLIEPGDIGIAGLEQLIAEAHDPKGRIQIVATPRFAISCTFEYLKRIAQVADRHDLFVQTHLSENLKEIDMTGGLFAGFKDYTDVYAQSGLLHERTLLGHGIYLSDDELDRIARARASIIHCPTSNSFLKSGILGVRRVWEHDVAVGLGTDIGAGYSLSMFDEMKSMIESSKYYALFVTDHPVVTPAEAFYTATRANAQILELSERIGSIEVGKDATFLMLVHHWEDVYSSPQDMLSDIIYRNEKQQIREFWVDGENVYVRE